MLSFREVYYQTMMDERTTNKAGTICFPFGEHKHYKTIILKSCAHLETMKKKPAMLYNNLRKTVEICLLSKVF